MLRVLKNRCEATKHRTIGLALAEWGQPHPHGLHTPPSGASASGTSMIGFAPACAPSSMFVYPSGAAGGVSCLEISVLPLRSSLMV